MFIVTCALLDGDMMIFPDKLESPLVVVIVFV